MQTGNKMHFNLKLVTHTWHILDLTAAYKFRCYRVYNPAAVWKFRLWRHAHKEKKKYFVQATVTK